jgi:hypothetical protein
MGGFLVHRSLMRSADRTEIRYGQFAVGAAREGRSDWQPYGAARPARLGEAAARTNLVFSGLRGATKGRRRHRHQSRAPRHQQLGHDFLQKLCYVAD